MKSEKVRWRRLEDGGGGGRRKLDKDGGSWKTLEDGGGWTREEVGGWRRLDVGGGRRWRIEEEERSRDTHWFCPEVGARHAAP